MGNDGWNDILRETGSQEYLDWLVDFVNRWGSIDDESAAYYDDEKYADEEDRRKGTILWAFCEHAADMACRKGHDPVRQGTYFDERETFVLANGTWLSCFETWGQGSWAQVKKMEEEPLWYIKIGRD